MYAVHNGGSMGLFRITDSAFEPVPTATFAQEEIRERQDLQRLLRDSIELIVPGGMVLAEEHSDWEDSRRRIDLLCLDDDASLVVVELKRGETGGHMELQAVRYAAMVAQMTFQRAVTAHARYLAARGIEEDAEERLLEFLGWDEADEENFAREVRIVLGAADFSTELTTAVLWLNERGLDIQCVQLAPYSLHGDTLVSIERVIPLPPAEAYQVRAREKAIGVRESRSGGGAFTGYWFVNVGEHSGPGNHRSWNDGRRYGFVSAGGNSVKHIMDIKPGDRFFAYKKGHGYVGAGVVTQPATPWEEFIAEDEGKPLTQLPLEMPHESDPTNPLREHCIGARWLRSVGDEQAVKAAFRRPTACRINDQQLVDELIDGFGIHHEEWGNIVEEAV